MIHQVMQDALNGNTIANINGHDWIFTRQKSTKPLQTARTIGAKLQHTIFICLEAKGNRYYSSFLNVHTFWDYYESYNPNERCFYWVNTSKDELTSSRLHFDIEWFERSDKKIDPWDRISLLVSEIRKALPEEVRNSQCHCEDSTRPSDRGMTKYSYHLVFPQVYFNSVGKDYMGTISQTVIDRNHDEDWLYYQVNNRTYQIIDRCIYRHNGLFRVIGSHKANSILHHKLPIQQVFLDTAICVPSPTRESHRELIHLTEDLLNQREPPFDGPVPIPIREPRNPSIRPDREASTISNRVAIITKVLKNKGDIYTKVIYHDGLYVGITDKVYGRNCLVAKHTSKSNGCYFLFKGQDIWYHCKSCNDSHSYCEGKKIGSLQDPARVCFNEDKYFTGKVDSGTSWHPGTQIYESDAELVEPIKVTLGVKCVLIGANMGSGKTYQTNKLIESLPKDDRIIAIVPRKSLSNTLHVLFKGFVHYLSPGWRHANRIIVEYESIHQLAADFIHSFKYVFVDEFRSVAKTMTQHETNGRNLQLNCETFKAFAQASEMFVGLDADMETDAAVSSLVNSWFRPETVAFHRYTHARVTRNIKLSVNKDAFYTSILTEVNRPDRTDPMAVCVRTKREGNVIKDFIEKLTGKDVLFISSDTSDADAQTLFEDINQAVLDVDVVIITSKVCVGVDITTPVSQCFVDGTGNGCSARNIIQMIGRFRHLVDNDVPFLVSHTNAIYIDEEELQLLSNTFFEERKYIIGGEYQTMLRRVPEFENGILHMAPDWVTQLFITCGTEQYRNFMMEIYRLSTLKQWSVQLIDDLEDEDIPDEAQEDHDEDIRTIKQDIKEAKEQFDEAIFDEVKVLDACLVREQAKEKIRKSEQTVKVAATFECASILRHYQPRILTYDEYKIAKKYDCQIRNHHKMRLSQDTQLKLAICTLGPWNDLTTTAFNLIHTKVIEMCTIAGFVSPSDYETSVDMSNLSVNQIESINTLSEECDYAANRRRRKGAKKTPAGCIRTELKYLFGSTLKSKRSGRGTPLESTQHSISISDILRGVIDKADYGYSEDMDIDINAAIIRLDNAAAIKVKK